MTVAIDGQGVPAGKAIYSPVAIFWRVRGEVLQPDLERLGHDTDESGLWGRRRTRAGLHGDAVFRAEHALSRSRQSASEQAWPVQVRLNRVAQASAGHGEPNTAAR